MTEIKIVIVGLENQTIVLNEKFYYKDVDQTKDYQNNYKSLLISIYFLSKKSLQCQPPKTARLTI